jgi:hypothetical protein
MLLQRRRAAGGVPRGNDAVVGFQDRKPAPQEEQLSSERPDTCPASAVLVFMACTKNGGDAVRAPALATRRPIALVRGMMCLLHAYLGRMSRMEHA